MLPPGHLAGGFLAAEALLKIAKPDLPQSQMSRLLVLGAAAGFAPDLDSFWSFFKEKSFTVRNLEKNDHRMYVSHAPIIWLLAGLAIYFFATSTFIKYAGLVIWLSSWSHFLLDSVEHGIMWLWPFSSKRFALVKSDLTNITTPGFFGYWMSHLKKYITKISFYLEIVIILSALIIYFK